MVRFFPVLFDSISALFAAEPMLYIVSIIGLAMVLYAVRILAFGR